MPRLAVLFLVAAAGLTAAAGCDSGPKVVPVSGTVLIDGQPLAHGSIQVSVEGHRAAAGKIGSDGRFTLTTTDDGDGVLVGTHKVIVVGTETLGPGAHKWHAPPAYAKYDTSGLTITVDKPTKDLKIELTWAGGKPFVEKFNKE